MQRLAARTRRRTAAAAKVERVKGIEPSYAAWEAAVLPLNYTRGGAILPLMDMLQRLVGAALGIVLFVAAFALASLALAVLVLAGLGVWGWLWWRSRPRRHVPERGAVIEGEYRDITSSSRIEKRERL